MKKFGYILCCNECIVEWIEAAYHPTLSARGTKGVGADGTSGVGTGDGVELGTGVLVGAGVSVGIGVSSASGTEEAEGDGWRKTGFSGSTAEEKSRLCVFSPAAPSTLKP